MSAASAAAAAHPPRHGERAARADGEGLDSLSEDSPDFESGAVGSGGGGGNGDGGAERDQKAIVADYVSDFSSGDFSGPEDGECESDQENNSHHQQQPQRHNRHNRHPHQQGLHDKHHRHLRQEESPHRHRRVHPPPEKEAEESIPVVKAAAPAPLIHPQQTEPIQSPEVSPIESDDDDPGTAKTAAATKDNQAATKVEEQEKEVSDFANTGRQDSKDRDMNRRHSGRSSSFRRDSGGSTPPPRLPPNPLKDDLRTESVSPVPFGFGSGKRKKGRKDKKEKRKKKRKSRKNSEDDGGEGPTHQFGAVGGSPVSSDPDMFEGGRRQAHPVASPISSPERRGSSASWQRHHRKNNGRRSRTPEG